MEEGNRPTADTIQAIMGQERDMAILEIAKTESVGFLNMPGMWDIALSRQKVAIVIVVNHTAMMKALESNDKIRPLLMFYLQLVQWFVKEGAFVRCPTDLVTTTATSELVNQTLRQSTQQEENLNDIEEQEENTDDAAQQEENPDNAAQQKEDLNDGW